MLSPAVRARNWYFTKSKFSGLEPLGPRKYMSRQISACHISFSHRHRMNQRGIMPYLIKAPWLRRLIIFWFICNRKISMKRREKKLIKEKKPDTTINEGTIGNMWRRTFLEWCRDVVGPIANIRSTLALSSGCLIMAMKNTVAPNEWP